MEYELEHWSLDRLIPYARNPRKNDHAVDKVAAAIREFGFRVPIVAKSDGTIVDGHLRYKAARKLGLDTVPIMLADDMTEAQIKAFRISVNKVAELAEWDNELLMLELSELQESEFDLSLIGFDDNELDTLLKALNDEPGELLGDEDEVPEAPTQPVTVLGDTWLLGKHRVRCGDSTSITDVDALMMGRKADMCFTDPPYGISLGYETPEQAKSRNRRTDGKIVANDNLKDDALLKFLTDALSTADAHLNLGAAFYVCSPIDQEVRKFIQAIEAVGWHYQSGLVWNKSSLSLSRHDYHPKHEIIHYGWKKGAAHRWFSDRKQTTVFDFDKPSRSVDHPTTKPVGLVEYYLQNVSTGGDLVLDLFLGSGTTLIAAEKKGRTCYGMELSPAYCDVIVKRWQSLTGKQATLESTSQTFAEIESERK
jgi:site-specific DNA-methyltransferase (adenine-specific)